MNAVIDESLEFLLDLNHWSVHLKSVTLGLVEELRQFLNVASFLANKFCTWNHRDRLNQLVQVIDLLALAQIHQALPRLASSRRQRVRDRKLVLQSLRRRLLDTYPEMKLVLQVFGHLRQLER